MKRKTYGRDFGLTLRMLLTGGLLGLLYVVFAVVLFSVLHAGLGLMLVIVIGLALFQYFTSDKIALAASGRPGGRRRGGRGRRRRACRSRLRRNASDHGLRLRRHDLRAAAPREDEHGEQGEEGLRAHRSASLQLRHR